MAVNWIGMLVGAIMGGMIAWATACPGNTCPLTARWYIPVIAGALLGLFWQPAPKKDESTEISDESDETTETVDEENEGN